MRLHGYPKIWNLGHPQLDLLLDGPVGVQEKVDGSQFSFGVEDTPDLERPILVICSKGADIYPPVADRNLFRIAVDTAIRLFEEDKLEPNWIYRGEAFHRPKHNTLAYNRMPVGGIVIFDIEVGENRFLKYEDLVVWAGKLGLEVVPQFFYGSIEDLDQMKELADRESFLGGTKMEGVVIKNFEQYDRYGKVLMGKMVREEFREAHSTGWKKRGKAPLLDRLAEQYPAEPRWIKALQHLAERGELQHAPQDIGPTLKEIAMDFIAEEEERVKQILWNEYSSDIIRRIQRGFPYWYKERLLERQFTKEES
jgi:hypothetical protein